MSFYICPPSAGTTDLTAVLRDVNIRLKLLHIIIQCDGATATLDEQLCTLSFASESDSFIEFTSRDNNAHFLLRVVATGNSALEQLLLRAEPLLLLHRLRCGRSLHAPLLQLQKELQQAQDTLLASRVFKDAILQAHDVVEGVLAMKCTAEEQRCGGCCVTVPWPVVPQLVARRNVVLTQGLCRVPCHLAPQLLAELFTLLLRCGLRDLAHHRQLDRIARKTPHLHTALIRCVRQFLLSHQLQQSLQSGLTSSLPPLAAKDVSSSALLFPPCMLQLQRLLHRHRRLQHHQRYRYTVFLKGVGMPLDQNIAYWQDHYSCHAHHHATCEHSWPRHGARYVYSLRHVYGLEGRRVSARPHSCQQLQSLTPQPGDCGGCPFAAVAEGTRRDDTFEGDLEGGHSSVSVFSKRETRLLEGTGRFVSEQSDADGIKDGRECASIKSPLSSKNISSLELKDDRRKRRRQGENKIGGSTGSRELLRCNSFSMEFSRSETLSSSQTVLVDISNSQPNKDSFSTDNASQKTENYLFGRSKASSLKRKRPLSGLNGKLSSSPSVSFDKSPESHSPLPAKALNKTMPASSRPPLTGSVTSSDTTSSADPSSRLKRSPTTSSGPTTHLRSLLKMYGLPSSSTEAIVLAARQGHPALACRMTLASLLETAQTCKGNRTMEARAKVNVTTCSNTGDRGPDNVTTCSNTGVRGSDNVTTCSNTGVRGSANYVDSVDVKAKSCMNNDPDIKTYYDSVSGRMPPTVNTPYRSSSDTQIVVKDNIWENALHTSIESECYISPKVQHESRVLTQNITQQNLNLGILFDKKRNKTEYFCSAQTQTSRSIKSSHTILNRAKSFCGDGTNETNDVNALNDTTEAKQLTCNTEGVQLENSLPIRDKIRKLFVRTKSVYEHSYNFKANTKDVNVFDCLSVIDSTRKRHRLKGSAKCLEIAKRKKSGRKNENSNSGQVEELFTSSNILEDRCSVSADVTEDDCLVVYDSLCETICVQLPEKVAHNSHCKGGINTAGVPEVVYDSTSEHGRVEVLQVKDDKDTDTAVRDKVSGPSGMSGQLFKVDETSRCLSLSNADTCIVTSTATGSTDTTNNNRQRATLKCNTSKFFLPENCLPAFVALQSITTASSLSTISELVSKPCDTATVSGSSNIAMNSGQCRQFAIPFTADSGPSIEPCATPGHENLAHEVASHDTLPVHDRSWHQRARDPCDTSLNFVSPVQFYALLMGLSRQC